LKDFTAKDIALVAVFSAIWIASQTYLGPTIGRITGIHGVVQRFLGWLLMLVLARITGRFGRVTVMAMISSLATRFSRLTQIYSLFVGLGYAVGGLAFDMLYFLPKNQRNISKKYVIFVSMISGVIASIPYIFLYLFTLGFYGFLIWFSTYVPDMIKSTVLSVAGTLTGLSILPSIETKIRYLYRK